MKKTNGLKRFVAFITAIMMVLGCVNIFAADVTSDARDARWETTNSNDILQVKSRKAGRQYRAYQLFTGEEIDNHLGSISWGASVEDSKALIKALKASTLADTGVAEAYKRENTIAGDFSALTEESSAAELATAIMEIGNESDDADTFAYIVMTELKRQGGETILSDSGTQINASDATEGYHYSFGAVHDGYYLVEETTAIKSGETASRAMVKVQGPTTIVSKVKDAPTIDKNIVKEDGTTAKYDDVAIGDTVSFKLESAVPNMDGYNKYFFIMSDVLSKGLTYDPENAELKVTLNGVTLTQNTDYYVTLENAYGDTDYDDTKETYIKIVFIDFISHKGAENDPIVVTYKATVNDKVSVGKVTDNFNKVQLIYSNNPNVTYVGKGKPDDEHPEGNEDTPGDEPNKDEEGSDDEDGSGSIGTSQWSTVYVYTTALNIIKVSSETDMRLSGATFTVKGTKLNKVIEKTYKYTPDRYYEADNDAEAVTSGSTKDYVKKADGNFEKNTNDMYKEAVKYKDNQGTEKSVTGGYYKNITDPENPVYETTMQENATYEMGSIVYTREVVTETKVIPEAGTWKGTVGEDGVVTIEGLSAGDYVITEVTPPYGYNKLENPISMRVELKSVDESSNLPTWYFTFDKNGGSNYKEDQPIQSNGTQTLRVENAMGSTLPSTGGMGTTVFYVLGSILMAAAAILLISKRRMSNWN
jgi:fimbrial isopeptide formation D2 family protein/LPXTG-motif cell wall-anchored protein